MTHSFFFVADEDIHPVIYNDRDIKEVHEHDGEIAKHEVEESLFDDFVHPRDK